ncbi:hypothetical protein KC644_01670 [Candidatus Berkelbacteria bacterium]|nr:hypothetical protein [Candidatus Berkelbacteria bacterium]
MRRFFSTTSVLLLLLTWLIGAQSVGAATLTNETVAISDPTIGNTGVSYSLTVDGQTTATIRCITVRFTDSLGSVSPIGGMSIAGSSFNASSSFVPTPGSWTLTASDATGLITLINAGGESPAGGAGQTLVLDGITNGSTKGITYYAEINSYSDAACTTGVDDGLGLFALTDGVLVTSSVVETLNFSLDAAGCSLGVITETQTASCSVSMRASTNRGLGYTISYTGEDSLTESQNLDTITAIGSAAKAPLVGTEQFGFNLVANTTPAIGSNPSGGIGSSLGQYSLSNLFAYSSSGADIAKTIGPSAETLYIMSFIANASTSTVAGNYNVKQTLTIIPNL